MLYATDGDYAFPLVKAIARRLNGEGPAIEDFILVGLSYALGDEPMPSRRRDYTPTPEEGPGAPPVATHGKSAAYIAYLREQVLPFIAQHYRTDEQRRLYLGHSYGGLLGTEILLSTPQMFSGYILGSPSYWYGAHVMAQREAAYATIHTDLPAQPTCMSASTNRCVTTRTTTWSPTHGAWCRRRATATIRRCGSTSMCSTTKTTSAWPHAAPRMG
ncbi:putative alpha/beta superfamily hydrolase [Xanthomonas arboricola]|nr:putative alpha/beta superfamily hydrolase [Xanthomonas cannabis]